MGDRANQPGDRFGQPEQAEQPPQRQLRQPLLS
jgi:hypothetical protein